MSRVSSLTHKIARARIWRPIGRAMLYIVFLLVTFVVLSPVLWVILTSLKSEGEYLTTQLRIFPSTWRWDNYYKAVIEEPFLDHAVNTLWIALPSTVLTVLSASLVGFGFARHNAPLKNALFVLLLSMMMVPRMVIFVPTYFLYAKLGLLGTYWPWYLNSMMGLSFYVFLFRQFFAGFPKELEDAAEVDGCSRFRTYWQIFMPNALPAISVVAIFRFQNLWGDWFNPRMYLSGNQTTLSVLIFQAYREPLMNTPINTVMMAAVMVYMLPMIIIFFLMQKYIIRGIVTTGIKG